MKNTITYILIFITGITFSQENRINDYLSNVISKRNIPGVAVSVIKDQKVIYSNYRGYSDLENETKVNNNSVFQLASLTKPITALAIMKLVEDGKINIEHSITNYIDSLPENYKLITVKNLLTHTAGFPDQVNFEIDGSPVMDIRTKTQLDIILDKPLLFKPGEKASYADPGYFLLGMIIENASGMKYNDYLEQKIFNPLGMVNTQVDNKWEIIKNRVAPYRYINNKLINGRRDYQHELPSHFGLISTIEDLTKLDIALRANQIVSEATLQEMWKPAELNNGEDALVWGVNYGFGWMLGDIRGNKYAEHGGFSGTHALHFIDMDLSVIVLTNLDVFSGSDPRSIAHHIAGIVSLELAKPVNSIDELKDNHKMNEKLIVSFISSVKNDSDINQLTNTFSKYINELPNHIKDRLLNDLISMEEIVTLKEDNVANREIYKLGLKINRIIHYQFINNNKNSTYSFYMTKNNKIAWFSKWKD